MENLKITIHGENLRKNGKYCLDLVALSLGRRFSKFHLNLEFIVIFCGFLDGSKDQTRTRK
ncbi:hypothetical protein, partial [Bacillus amyloliquefaciens]|uniref:hypothetical protein n=1 Tax=Bacillus amyloliquefaciens TaxID=1390 RepID=UPI00197AC55F